MSIEKLEKTKESFTERYNFIRTQEPLREIIYSLLDVQNYMREVIDTLKDQSDEIANLRQELAKKEDIIEVNEIREVRNLNGD